MNQDQRKSEQSAQSAFYQ